MGIETGPDFVLVRHLDMAPSNRTDADYAAVLDELSAKVAPSKIMGSIAITPVIMRWEEAKKG